MANKISDETIEYVGILAKLELSPEEKEEAKKEFVTIHNMEITGGAAKSRPVLYRFSPILR